MKADCAKLPNKFETQECILTATLLACGVALEMECVGCLQCDTIFGSEYIAETISQNSVYLDVSL